MNRIVSCVYILVLLGVVMESLDARKLASSLTKRTDKRRYKRQDYTSYRLPSFFGCNDPSSGRCAMLEHSGENSDSLGRAILAAAHHHFDVASPVSIEVLRKSRMCYPDSEVLTPNAYSALDKGHLTVPQLATQNLIPIQNLDLNMLLTYNYMSTNNLLTGLGVEAAIWGHIVPSQLQPLNLYPLQTSSLSLDALVQAGYLTNDCLPTALGISALHIHYLSRDSLSSLGCSMTDYSQVTLVQLTVAKYVYGTSNIITPVGLAALRTRSFPKENYQRLGLFPCGAGAQTPSPDADPESNPAQTSAADLVHAGYFSQNNLITGSGYHALAIHYLTPDYLRGLNLWPCQGTPSLGEFVAAGYATYTAHLTTLGRDLLHAQYYSEDTLSKLGIHLHHEFSIFHYALIFAGYLHSEYHAIQAAARASSAGYSPSESVPYSTYQLSSDGNAPTQNANVGFRVAQ